MPMTFMRPLAAAAILALIPAALGGQTVPGPQEVLGHRAGESGVLADWAAITRYFDRLDESSPLVRVLPIGETVLGRPMIMAVVTSEANHARLDEIRATQAMLADPRGHDDAEIAAAIADHPAVAFIGASLHGNEIMATQMSMELAHDLVTDPALRRALDDVVVLLVPGMNPDGLDITREWWMRTRLTEHDGAPLPWLYHHYVGHDNNRDFFMLTQPETRAINQVLYHEWFPQVVYDVHQMGSGGARLFIPPFADPLNPNLDPLLVRLTNVVGAQMALALTAAGKTGVAHRTRFDLWWNGGARTVPARHNMIGILSEAASARYGDPIRLDPDSIDHPEVGSIYPEPWTDSIWTPRDIVEYELIAATALVRLLERQRVEFLEQFVALGRRQVERGRTEAPHAFVLPADQRDPATAMEMLRLLAAGGVEVHRTTRPIDLEGRTFPAGSHVVDLAQPYRAHAKDLLEPQRYPERRLYPGGPPEPPYDLAGWTLPLQMGVEVVRAATPLDPGALERVTSFDPPAGVVAGVGPSTDLVAVDPRLNAAHRVIHEVLGAGGSVTFASEPLPATAAGQPGWGPGTPVVSGLADLGDRVERWAREWGVRARGLAAPPPGRTLDRLRVGLYKPWTASMDEGWTRWLFETWGVPFDTIHDARIRAGDLGREFDTIVLPSLGYRLIMEGPARAHPDFAGGLGEAGAQTLESFVRDGGTLVLLADASTVGIERFDLPIRDVRAEQDPDDPDRWYAPGSLLRVVWDAAHPVASGMPGEGAVFYARSPVFEVEPGASDIRVIARYPEADLLMSGYAQGEDRIAGRAALVEARVGAGRVVMFGFSPQHRAQPHLTFKALFNALYLR